MITYQQKLHSNKRSPLETVTDDLMILIQQIEERPSISHWSIRMTLKAIRDQAQTTAQNSIQPEKLAS
ncbi:MAG TPA: hypothetical protein V6D28_16205 [Leptolyngbyaceae cyanobacterium]